MFDSFANELAPHDFATFSAPYLAAIASGVREKLQRASIPPVPMILFAKGASHALGSLSNIGYDVLGLDWAITPEEAIKSTGGKVALQGNLDPNVLYGGRDAIEREVKRMALSFKGGEEKRPKGWIAGLGHGITPGVNPEDLRWFFECVHRYSSTT